MADNRMVSLDSGLDESEAAERSTSRQSKTPRGTESPGGGGGCYVSTVAGFALVLLALLLAVGLGLLVHFASSRPLVCKTEDTQVLSSGASQDAVSFCKVWVEDGGTSSKNICQVCSSSQTSSGTASSGPGAGTATTTPPPSYPPIYRLPTSLTPSHYTLRLQAHFYGTDSSIFYFEGNGTIDVTCHDVTDVITLHADQLDIREADVTVREQASGVSLDVREISYEAETQFYRIRLGDELRKGAQYQVMFATFSGPLKNDYRGLSYTSYFDGDRVVNLLASYFAPTFARKAFPCFDEPAMKATFHLTLLKRSDTARDYTTLTNVHMLRSLPSSSPGWVEDVYETVTPMSTYMLDFVVSDFDHLSNWTMGVNYRTWFPLHAEQQAMVMQELGLKLLEFCETHFRPSYTTYLDKLDNVLVPEWTSNDIATWGRITYGTPLTKTPGPSSLHDRQKTASFLAHGIVHVWFGNMVTPTWWSWLWLQEGLASFWQMQMIDDLFPSWRMIDEHLVTQLYPTMTSDSLSSSHPMTTDVESPEEILSNHDPISDIKGAFLMRMIQFIMGPDKFLEGINNFLVEHTLRNVEPSDLWAALNNVSQTGLDMAVKMDPWVTLMGYPVVMVTRPGNGMLLLEQQPFRLGSQDVTDQGSAQQPQAGYQWDIPITIACSRDANFTKTADDVVWLRKGTPLRSVTDPTEGDDRGWYVLNVQQYGYYRVHYDLQNWLNLIHQLNTDHKVIHPINRAQIVNDAWNLATAGMLDMKIALKTTEFLSRETDYLPWHAFVLEISYVQLMLERTEMYSSLKNFILDLVSGPLQELGLDIAPDLDPMDVYVRERLADLACPYGHPACVSLAQQQFSYWMTTGHNRMDINLRWNLYCTAVERGSQGEWDFVMDRLRAEQDAAEQRRLLRALACAKDPAVLRKLLKMALMENGSRALDFPKTLSYVSANRWGRDVSFRFLVEHFPSLAVALGTRMNKAIRSVTAHFNTRFDLRRLEMLQSMEANSTIASAITEARLSTRSNMAWLQHHWAGLKSWLQREEKEERINYRLPGHVVPRHYQLEFQPHIYGNDSSAFHFEGSVVIHLQCVSATDVITLHVDRLAIRDDVISVKQANSQKQLFQSSSYDQLRHFWHLRLTDSLQAGKSYVVEFRHFSGPLRADGKGLYLSHYREGLETVYLARTQMQDLYARKAFPCLDEPQLKATFDVTLLRRNDSGRAYVTLANTPLIDTQFIQDTDGRWWAKDRFERTPILPTYLLAFMVSDFTCGPWENVTASDPNVTYRTYARPNAIQWAGRAHEYGLKLFDWMNRRFQPNYGRALSKLDNVVVPDLGFGAMENWGLIMYTEPLLYQPGVTSAQHHFWMTYILTHEISHTWFGNYVSNKWWDWLWLNEALASWWNVYVTEQVFPDWKVTEEWLTTRVYRAMDADALSTSHPMNRDVQSPFEIGAIFDYVTYIKGSVVVGMMQFIMGFDTFLDGLNLYLANHLYGSVEPSDLFSALDQKMREQHFSNAYMTTKMDPWVSQNGYPVVMVTRTATGYHLTQKRFLIGSEEKVDKRYKDVPYNYQWEIPIIYATRENPNMEKSRDDIHWLSKNSYLDIPDPEVNDTDSWILINVNQMAFCRVMYDPATWRALIGQLNRDPSVIPAINRGQIINDAWNLAKAGQLEMSVALSTLDFLQGETELVPWRAVAREMHYLQLMLDTTPLFPLLQTYMRDTLQKPLQMLTLTIHEGMVPTDVFVRTLVAQLACSYGMESCVKVAKRLFSDWKHTSINEINADLREVFYCTAVAEGDVTDWQFVYTQYKSADVSTELTNLRKALSCTRDQTLIRRLLTMTLDPEEIRFQDLASTVQSVAANTRGRDLAFQFFVDNFDHLKNTLEPFVFGKVLTAVTSHFNSDYNLHQLEQLSMLRDVSAVSSLLEQAYIRTRSNMAWLRDHRDVIRDWLTRRKASPPLLPAPGSYRLPKDLEPHHYMLSLQPHIYGDDPTQFFFQGNVTIFFRCLVPTNTITLHQDRLLIDPTTIIVTTHDVNFAAVPLAVEGVTEEARFHFYRIRMRDALVPQQTYSLQIPAFRGAIRRGFQGLYLSSYKDGDRTVYLAVTQMEPTWARHVFPCFDEPAMKATFNVTLVRRTDTGRPYVTLSNMPVISSQALDEAWTADIFQQTPRMSTYLLAFVVCDFSHLSNFSSRFPVETRTYARSNRIQDVGTAHRYSVELFDWYNSRFQPAYETYMSKIDHIAVPDFLFGAMENWGLVIYRERLLYYSLSTASQLAWAAEVLSHELAHMWFGNMVSPKWWTWVWLNEALAEYWQSYAVEQLYPSWKTSSVVQKAVSEMYVMQVDSFSFSHPLSNPVDTPAQALRQFDTIAYSKGCAIIGMMHMIMGEHFIPALNVYLQDNLLGNVEHKDLFDSLNKYISSTSDIDVNMTEKMEPWVTQMGYPVVNVHRRGDRLLLSQQRFVLGSTSPADTGAYGYKFEVPITYTCSSEKNFNKSRSDIHWLRADGSPLEIPLMSSEEQWVVVNLRHQGYYRVNYDIATWKALIAQLNTAHTVFDQMNRAALIDDAFNLVKAELLPLEIALQTVDYMWKETDFGPWRTFAREMDQLEVRIERTELFADFQRYMQRLVDEPLQTLGTDPPADNDPPILALTISLIMADACKYDHVTCVTKATSMVFDWRHGLGNTINVNLRSVLYCTAVREGGQDVWDFIYDKYQAEADPVEKDRLRAALGCSKDPTILNTFLDMCLYDEDVPRMETPSCVSAVAANRYGRDVALTFVWEHFDQLKNSFPDYWLGSMVNMVTQHFHTNFHLAQLQFLRDREDVSGIVSTLDMIGERTVTTLRWMRNNYNTIRDWLRAETWSPTTTLQYRLPTSVTPLHYDLELRPEIYTSDPSTFTFTGTVTILIEVQEPTNVITLHSYLLEESTIRDSARLLFDTNGTDSGYVTEVTFDEPRDFLSLVLSREIPVGERLRLYLEFSAPLGEDGVGLYYTSYWAENGSSVYMVASQFEAPYARRAMPCFDEPALKATWNVTLLRKAEHRGRQYKSWTNSLLLKTQDRGNGYFADVFRTTPLISTYLLAFIVADFQCLTNDTRHGLKFSTCARPEVYEEGQVAQDLGVEMMEWLEDHFDPPYSMPKLDSMAVPNLLPTGMENWGLITYREVILHQRGVTSATDKHFTFMIIAHELAHTWFGNIVSPQWWSWVWLNEAFATFWSFALGDILQPDLRQMDQFVVTKLYPTMTSDSLTSSHPLTVDVESLSDFSSILDLITYYKGAAIVRTMDFIMGEDQFIAALNVYLQDNQDGVANHTSLLDALDKHLMEEGLPLRMTEVMEPWVTQSHYPVVHVRWTGSGQVMLTQQRFLYTGPDSQGESEDQAPFGYTWDIPITMATSISPRYDVSSSDITWFKKSESEKTMSGATIPAPPTEADLSRWLLLNVRQYGYYRVNYPEVNWMALIQQLKTNPEVIHPINRGQIINDAWSLARAGYLSMSVALQTLQVLKNDGDYVPWQAISGELSYLDLMLSRKEIYGMFQNYMAHLVNSSYDAIGMTSDPSDPPIQIYQRQRMVTYACMYAVQQCKTEARRQFAAWRSDPENTKLEVDMRAVILCNGIRWGDKEDWDYVYERYRNSDIGSEKSDLLFALSCSPEIWLLHRLLDLTLNSSVIVGQDVRYVLQDVSANPIGQDMAFTFLKQHFRRLSKLMFSGAFGLMLEALTRHFNTQHQLDELKLFMAQNDVSEAMMSFRQAVEQTSLNVRWMRDHYQQIRQFLQNPGNW